MRAITLDALAELPPEQLIRFTCEALLRTEVGNRFDWGMSKLPFTEWYLRAGTGADDAAPAGDSAERTEGNGEA